MASTVVSSARSSGRETHRSALRCHAPRAVLHLPVLVPFGGASEALVRQGAGGVTTFFVLSGVVLTYDCPRRVRRLDGRCPAFPPRPAGTNKYRSTFSTMAIITPLVLTDDGTARWPDGRRHVGGQRRPGPRRRAEQGDAHVEHPVLECVALFFYALFPFFIYFVVSRVPRHGRSLLTLGIALVRCRSSPTGSWP